jgi:structural maintenance of chromosome 2
MRSTQHWTSRIREHIGTLFCTRFRGAQFIVVSLKEGQCTNADVLFRMGFRDGTSVVEHRTNWTAQQFFFV